jgi:hypothetical protein
MLAAADGRNFVSVPERYPEIDEHLLDLFGGRRWPPAPFAGVRR